jgi:hypothetical protein
MRASEALTRTTIEAILVAFSGVASTRRSPAAVSEVARPSPAPTWTFS